MRGAKRSGAAQRAAGTRSTKLASSLAGNRPQRRGKSLSVRLSSVAAQDSYGRANRRRGGNSRAGEDDRGGAWSVFKFALLGFASALALAFVVRAIINWVPRGDSQALDEVPTVVASAASPASPEPNPPRAEAVPESEGQAEMEPAMLPSNPNVFDRLHWFPLARIDVRGLVRAKRETVLVMSGLKPGQSLLAMSPADIQASIERHPWIAQVHVQRVFPERVEIDVIEHEPIALVALDHLYYANVQGELVKRYAPGERETLPVITGLDRVQIERGDAQALAGLGKAIALVHDLAAPTAHAPAVAEVHVDPAAGLSIVPRGQSLRINLGWSAWGDQIQRLALVQSALLQRSLRAAEITLGGERRSDRVVARLAGLASATTYHPSALEHGVGASGVDE